MKKSDTLLRLKDCIEDLYSEMNCEVWTYDEKLYDKEMGRFAIVRGVTDFLIQNVYGDDFSKEDVKKWTLYLIDKYL